MSYKKSIFLLIHIAVFILIIVPVGNSTTWYVRKDGTGDYDCISSAIRYAHSGDSILVGPGTYCTIGGFLIKKSLHIISEYGPEVTVVNNAGHSDPGMLPSGSYAFDVIYPDGEFTIKGFKMRGHQCCGFQDIYCYTMLIHGGNGVISDNIFCENDRYTVVNIQVSSVLLENNLFYSNNADAINMGYSNADIRFNTIVGNREGISIDSNNNVTIQNNIIVSNIEGINCNSPAENIVIECNNIWNNTSGNYLGTITDQTGINGNISLDPLFCGIPRSGNFYLQSDSPCAASNVPEFCNGIRMGAYPVYCDVGTEETSWGKIKSLYK